LLILGFPVTETGTILGVLLCDWLPCQEIYFYELFWICLWGGWLAQLIWWLFTFRPIPCHSQSGQQCSHQHQCHLWWEGTWDVLQTRGARAWPTCTERTVPGLWWQQCEPQRQVHLALFSAKHLFLGTFSFILSIYCSFAYCMHARHWAQGNLCAILPALLLGIYPLK
jgi:hypothetical protein